MSFITDLYSPGPLAQPATPPKFDIGRMDLGQMIYALIDHCLSFEQIRAMTLEQIAETFERINAGEIKTWAQVKEERAAAIEAARQKGRTK